VTSPAKAGYTVDLAAVTGTITGDTEINVFYTKRTYTLTVKFQTTSGRELTDSLVMQMQSGDSYSFAVPEFEGYEALTARVEGVMNSQNKEVIVTYIEVAETNEEGQKVYTITGKPTVMINDYMTPLGIGQINRGGGEGIIREKQRTERKTAPSSLLNSCYNKYGVQVTFFIEKVISLWYCIKW